MCNNMRVLHVFMCCEQVWLLEMNCNPALHANCEVLKEVIPRTVVEALGELAVVVNKHLSFSLHLTVYML